MHILRRSILRRVRDLPRDVLCLCGKRRQMKVFNDKPGTRFRIRNGVTGGYVHITMMRVLEFKDRLEALVYIKQHDLNPMIYYVEVVK